MRQPAARPDYWIPKLSRTVARDAANDLALASLGWKVLVIWECETRDAGNIEAKLRGFFESGS